LDKFQSTLGYRFSDPALLQRALKHRSAGKDHNERLEFFGDAILGFIVSAYLYQQLPDASEGELSRLRAALVQQATLAGIARELDLGRHMILGAGELKSGGANRDSMLADALEALICALYLDAGIETCMVHVSKWFGARLAQQSPSEPVKDPKTSLQEWLQARHQPLPVYKVVDVDGKEHQQIFMMSCTLPATGESFTGCGQNRKQAEQRAAQAALDRLAPAAPGAAM